MARETPRLRSPPSVMRITLVGGVRLTILGTGRTMLGQRSLRHRQRQQPRDCVRLGRGEVGQAMPDRLPVLVNRTVHCTLCRAVMALTAR